MRGPRLPAGAAPPLSRPRRASPGFSPSAGVPRLLGSREPWERGAREGVLGSRGAVRASAGPGSLREQRVEGGGGAGGGARPREVRGPGAGCRPDGAGGAGLSPGSGGRKGSHPSRPPGLPSPPGPAPPAPRSGGRPAGRDRVAARGRRWLGLSGRVCSLRPGLDFLLRRAPPRTFCGGRGEGSGIASAAGKWRPGRGRPADRPGLCLRRPFLRSPAARLPVRRGGPGSCFPRFLYSGLRLSS